MKYFRFFIGILLFCLFTVFSGVAFYEDSLFIAVVLLSLSFVTLIVWWKKDFLSYRFLYPGMLCFFLFTILPIIFSIIISFSNLGTGHFYSKEKVKKILLEEKEILPESSFIKYSLFELSNDEYFIETKKGSSRFKLVSENLNIELSDLDYREKLGERMSFSEIQNIYDKLKNIVFITPDGKYMSYHRVDELVESRKAFQDLGPNKGIKELSSGYVFLPNDKIGFYYNQLEQKALIPGYYSFLGFQNYRDLFTKKEFKSVFLKVSTWTFLWAFFSVILTFSLGMSLAIFLNDKGLRFKAIYRNLLILPYSIPFFISVLIFKGMLSKDFGVVNALLRSLSLPAIPWLENAIWAKVSCLMVNLWLGFPYMFLVTTGILQSISQNVYDAAKIDGASRFQTFKSITFPMILSAVTPLLIGSFAFNLGNFVGIYLLTGGGPSIPSATTPAGETDILISYTYRLAFEGAKGQQFGLASSITLFIFLVIGFLTALNLKFFNKAKEV